MAHPGTPLSDADFAATIYRRGGRTFAVSADRGVIAEGSTADEAIERLRADAAQRQSLFAAAGLAGARRPTPGHIPFLIKTAAVALACVVAIFAAELAVDRALVDLPRRMASLALAAVDQLGYLSQWVSEERKREIGRSIRVALDNLQPAIEEVRPSLSDVQRGPGGEPKSAGQ